MKRCFRSRDETFETKPNLFMLNTRSKTFLEKTGAGHFCDTLTEGEGLRSNRLYSTVGDEQLNRRVNA